MGVIISSKMRAAGAHLNDKRPGATFIFTRRIEQLASRPWVVIHFLLLSGVLTPVEWTSLSSSLNVNDANARVNDTCPYYTVILRAWLSTRGRGEIQTIRQCGRNCFENSATIAGRALITWQQNCISVSFAHLWPERQTRKQNRPSRGEITLRNMFALNSSLSHLQKFKFMLCEWNSRFVIVQISVSEQFHCHTTMNIEWTLNVSRRDAFRDDNTRNKIYAKRWKRKQRMRKSHRKHFL